MAWLGLASHDGATEPVCYAIKKQTSTHACVVACFFVRSVFAATAGNMHARPHNKVSKQPRTSSPFLSFPCRESTGLLTPVFVCDFPAPRLTYTVRLRLLPPSGAAGAAGVAGAAGAAGAGAGAAASCLSRRTSSLVLMGGYT